MRLTSARHMRWPIARAAAGPTPPPNKRNWATCGSKRRHHTGHWAGLGARPCTEIEPPGMARRTGPDYVYFRLEPGQTGPIVGGNWARLGSLSAQTGPDWANGRRELGQTGFTLGSNLARLGQILRAPSLPRPNPKLKLRACSLPFQENRNWTRTAPSTRICATLRRPWCDLRAGEHATTRHNDAMLFFVESASANTTTRDLLQKPWRGKPSTTCNVRPLAAPAAAPLKQLRASHDCSEKVGEVYKSNPNQEILQSSLQHCRPKHVSAKSVFKLPRVCSSEFGSHNIIQAGRRCNAEGELRQQ